MTIKNNGDYESIDQKYKKKGRWDYFLWVREFRVVKLITHLHLGLRMGKGGAMSSFCNVI